MTEKILWGWLRVVCVSIVAIELIGGILAQESSQGLVVNGTGVEVAAALGDFSDQVAFTPRGDIHVVFSGHQQGEQRARLYYRKFSRSTKKWTTELEADERGSSFEYPSLSVQGGAVYISSLVVKRRGEHLVRFFRKQGEAGAWSHTDLKAGYSTRRPKLSSDGKDLLRLLFSSSPEPDSPERLWIYESDDGGEHWEANVPPSGAGTRRAFDPILSCRGAGGCYLAWLTEGDAGTSVVVAGYDEKTRKWGTPAVVSEPGNLPPSEVQLAVFGNRVMVFWVSGSLKRRQIYMDCSSDRGQSWQGDQMLLDRRTKEFGWRVVQCSDELWLIWREAQGSSQRTRYSVWVRRITEGGDRILAPKEVMGGEEEFRDLKALCGGDGLMFAGLRANDFGSVPVLFEVGARGSKVMATVELGDGRLASRDMLTLGEGWRSPYVAFRKRRAGMPFLGGALQGGDLVILEVDGGSGAFGGGG